LASFNHLRLKEELLLQRASLPSDVVEALAGVDEKGRPVKPNFRLNVEKEVITVTQEEDDDDDDDDITSDDEDDKNDKGDKDDDDDDDSDYTSDDDTPRLTRKYQM